MALTSFFGHSGPTEWTFDGPLASAEIGALSNADRPKVVTQRGCWNTYYVAPTANTMAHQFCWAATVRINRSVSPRGRRKGSG
jgi:hypothetical protein